MGLFGQKKPRVTREKKEDWILFNVGYYPSKEPERYRQHLLYRLLASQKGLAVVNTRFMYEKQKEEYLVRQKALMEKLEALGVSCKAVQIKRKKERAILGVSVTRNENATYMDPVMGIVLEEDQMDDIISLLQAYNVYYYLGPREADLTQVLERLTPGLDHEDILEKEFSHKIFDDNFVKSITVYCPPEDADRIEGILKG